MGRRRQKQAPIEDLFKELYELTSVFWQIGLVVAAILAMGAIWSLHWAVAINAEQTQPLATIAKSIGWLAYSLPLFLSVAAWIFGAKAHSTYEQQHTRW